jgi:hypothetical protein
MEGKLDHDGSGDARGLSGTTPAPTPKTTNQKAIFINAGGSNYTDSDGNTWVADTGYYNTGNVNSTSEDISSTNKPKIYQSERYQSEMTYRIPLLNGRQAPLCFVNIALHKKKTYHVFSC